MKGTKTAGSVKANFNGTKIERFMKTLKGSVKFHQRVSEVYDFVSRYGAVQKAQIDRILPQHRSELALLVKQNMLHIPADGYVSTRMNAKPSVMMDAAMDVLADVAGKVVYHNAGRFPADMVMVDQEGQHYEVIFVREGAEKAMLTTCMHHRRVNGLETDPKRILIVEREYQSRLLYEMPNLTAFVFLDKPQGKKYQKVG